MEDTAAAATLLEPVQLPAAGAPIADFCLQLECSMLKATWAGVAATQQVLTPQMLQSIVAGVAPTLEKEPTLIEVTACYSAGSCSPQQQCTADPCTMLCCRFSQLHCSSK
jgi:hypothetical protein